jgi:hypothetical protein
MERVASGSGRSGTPPLAVCSAKGASIIGLGCEVDVEDEVPGEVGIGERPTGIGHARFVSDLGR